MYESSFSYSRFSTAVSNQVLSSDVKGEIEEKSKSQVIAGVENSERHSQGTAEDFV